LNPGQPVGDVDDRLGAALGMQRVAEDLAALRIPAMLRAGRNSTANSRLQRTRR
jgi:hypothetical protein